MCVCTCIGMYRRARDSIAASFCLISRWIAARDFPGSGVTTCIHVRTCMCVGIMRVCGYHACVWVSCMCVGIMHVCAQLGSGVTTCVAVAICSYTHTHAHAHIHAHAHGHSHAHMSTCVAVAICSSASRARASHSLSFAWTVLMGATSSKPSSSTISSVFAS